MRFPKIAFLAVTASAWTAFAQTTPAGGTITAIPAASRLDVDGNGSTDAASLTQDDGFCTFWAKGNAGGVPSTTAQTIALIDNGTNRASPDESFRSLLPIMDFDDGLANAITPVANSVTAPWTNAGARVCTSHAAGTNSGTGNYTQFENTGVRARGNLHITTPGTKTVFVNTDDGYSLRIGGVVVVQFDDNRGTQTDSRRFSVSQPGIYPIEFIYWEQGGAAVAEVGFADGEITFAGNVPQGGGGGSDLSQAGGFNSLPAGFSILGVPRVGRDTWGPAAESCTSLVNQPVDICGGPAADACGNGTIEVTSTGVETCDDRNTTAGDGCSALCQVEATFACSGQPSVCAQDSDG
jgi:cysteine-rich repeat protein